MLLPKAWDWLGDPTGGLGLVKGPYQRSGTGRETLLELRDRSVDPPGGLGWVGGPTCRSGMGRGTLPGVQDRLGTL